MENMGYNQKDIWNNKEKWRAIINIEDKTLGLFLNFQTGISCQDPPVYGSETLFPRFHHWH